MTLERRASTLAKVPIDGGAMYLPVDTAYDRDLLFEHLERIARNHRQARLEIMEQQLLVSRRAEHEQRCGGCGRTLPVGGIQHCFGDHALCGHCARRRVDAVGGAAAAAPSLRRALTG